MKLRLVGDGKAFDKRRRNGEGPLAARRLNERALAGNRNRLVERPDLEGHDAETQAIAAGDREPRRSIVLKPCSTICHAVGVGRQVRHEKFAVRFGDDRAEPRCLCFHSST